MFAEIGHWGLVIHWSLGFWSFLIPPLPSIFRHDAAQGVNVRLGQLIFVLVKFLPRIPLRADQFAGDSIALRRSEINTETRSLFKGHPATLLLLERFGIKGLAHSLLPAGQDFVKKPS